MAELSFIDYIVALLILIVLTVYIPYVVKLVKTYQMRRHIIFPKTGQEILEVYQHALHENGIKPNSKVYTAGIGLAVSGLVILLLYLLIILTSEHVNYFSLLLLFLPFINGRTLIDVFGIVKEGMILKGIFTPWEQIESVEFIPITVQHRYFGLTREAGNGEEMKIIKKKQGLVKSSFSYVVTLPEVKTTYLTFFQEHNLRVIQRER